MPYLKQTWIDDESVLSAERHLHIEDGIYDTSIVADGAVQRGETIAGLNNVNNTSDANKPISIVQQGALNLKANIAGPTFTGTVSGITAAMVGLGNVDNVSDANKPISSATTTALNLKANIASQTFTGTPTLPSGTIFVTPTLPTGTIAVTQTAGNSTTAIATTAFATTALNLKANIASPTFTGAITGRINPRITTVASSATPSPDVSTADIYTITAQAVSAAFAIPAGTPLEGQRLFFRIKDNGTAQALAWNAIYRSLITGVLPSATRAGKYTYMDFVYNATDTKWDLVHVAYEGIAVGAYNSPIIAFTPQVLSAATANQLIVNSVTPCPPQGWQVGMTWEARITGSSTAAGTAASSLNINVGALGTNADPVVATVSLGTPTAAATDFEIVLRFRIEQISAGTVTSKSWAFVTGSATGMSANATDHIIMTPSTFTNANPQYIHAEITTGAAKVPTIDYCKATLYPSG